MKFLRILAILILLAGGALGALYYFAVSPFAGFEGQKFVEIPRGASTRSIAEMLTKAGVIERPWLFLLMRLLRPSTNLQAGEYRFTRPASTLDVYDRIARGDGFYFELVIPEGFNMFDIASAVGKLGVMPAGEFLAAARDPSLIRDLDQTAPTLEGYLFPDTYRLTRHTSAGELCRILTQRFRSEWKRLNSSAEAHQTVTLSSLIEKEAAVPDERPLVSAVFHNRLKIGMKLDCDPTTVYAALLEGRYRGKIYQSDLASDNPYNTYRHSGLPPGPIANPGIASLKAALHPVEADYLYFVARPDGSGRHAFSRDLASHAEAAARYRRGAKK